MLRRNPTIYGSLCEQNTGLLLLIIGFYVLFLNYYMLLEKNCQDKLVFYEEYCNIPLLISLILYFKKFLLIPTDSNNPVDIKIRCL